MNFVSMMVRERISESSPTGPSRTMSVFMDGRIASMPRVCRSICQSNFLPVLMVQAMGREQGVVETAYGGLEQSSGPDLVPVRRGQAGAAQVFSRQMQIEGQSGSRQHLPVLSIISPCRCQRGAAPFATAQRQVVADAGPIQSGCGAAATPGEVLISDDPGQLVKGGLDEPVAHGVGGQFVERTGDFALLQQVAAFRAQRVYPSPHAGQVGLATVEIGTEVAPEAALDGTGQDFGHQVWYVVGVLLCGIPPVAGNFAEQAGGVQHQEPDVPDRNLPDGSRDCLPGCRCAGHWARPWSSRSLSDLAVSRLSNQYSSRSGPISVSATCLNHFPGLSMGVAPVGVTTLWPTRNCGPRVASSSMVRFSGRQTPLDVDQEFGIDIELFTYPGAPAVSEGGFQVDEAESSPQGQIHQGQRPVGDVHGADDVEVGRNVHPLPWAPGVAERQRLLMGSLVRLQQGEHLTEYLGGVPPVYFLDNDHVVVGRVVLCDVDRL